jgi:hypothetical protein
MKKLFILAIIGMLASCTSTITKVTEENRMDVQGLRFSRPTPYLLVAAKDVIVDGVKSVKENGKAKETTTQKMAIARKELECSLIYLPNPQEEYVIDAEQAEELGLVLKDGWMLTAMYGVSAEELPQGLFVDTQKASMLNSYIGKLTGTMDLQPGFYQIVFDGAGITGLKKVKVIH